jgi:Arc/MetJ family transcription regulator
MIWFNHMKTTLDLDDAILTQAKQRSAALGTTLRAFVEDALRARLIEPPKGRKRYRYKMNVVRGNKPPAIDISDRRALYDYLDGLK